MPVTIRRAEPNDTVVVAEFNRLLAWESEHKALDPAVLGRGVARLSPTRPGASTWWRRRTARWSAS